MGNGAWDEPTGGSGDFVKPKDLAGHLVIIWPVGYVPHIQTRFTRPDKKSDAIQVDVVDLDAPGDGGTPGRLYRTCNFMQAQLIGSLKPRIGGRLLGVISLGLARNGMNPPWVFQSLTSDPQAVARAQAWADAHPDFAPSEFAPVIQAPPQAPQYQGPPPTQYPQQRPAPGHSHWEAPEASYIHPPQQPPQVPTPQYQQPVQPQYPPPQVPPQYQVPAAPVPGSAPVSPEEMSLLQRLRAQQQANADRLPDQPDQPFQGPVPF
jgi:hypothetical protein